MPHRFVRNESFLAAGESGVVKQKLLPIVTSHFFYRKTSLKPERLKLLKVNIKHGVLESATVTQVVLVALRNKALVLKRVSEYSMDWVFLDVNKHEGREQFLALNISRLVFFFFTKPPAALCSWP